MKKPYKGLIPFGDYKEFIVQGKVVRPARRQQLDYPSFPGGDIIWKENRVFIANLKIESYSRGRSAANWDAQILDVYCDEDKEYEDFLQGVYVNIFMTDMLDIILNNDIYHGVITQSLNFAFSKRGGNYGLTFFESPV